MARRHESASIDGAPTRPDQLRSTARGAQTRQRILEAAEQIFAQRGFAATRVEDIATAVGIRKPSVIHHFAGKEELHNEIMSRLYQELLERTAPALDLSESGPRRVLKIIDTWLDFVSARPTAGRLLLRSVADSSFMIADMSAHASDLLAIWLDAIHAVAPPDQLSDTEALELLSLLGGAALTFVSMHSLLAATADAGSNEQGLLEPFRQMLHRSALVVLGLPEQPSD